MPHRALAITLSSCFVAALTAPAAALAVAAPGAASASASPSPAGQPSPAAAASSSRAASSSPAAAAASTSPAGSPSRHGSPSPAASSSDHRVALPGSDGKPVPYTIEIPADWQVHSAKEVPGVFLGPADVSQPGDPRAIWVRDSPTPMFDPYAVVAKIKERTATDFSWSAPVLEVRDVGGIRGVLVRMDSGSGDQARSTLVLKVPYRQASLDFMASAPRAEFERRLPEYRRILFSVQPVTR